MTPCTDTVSALRIVVVGHSLGGYHTLRMAIEGTMHNSRRKPPQGQDGDSDADCGHEEGRKANDWIPSAVSAMIPPPVKAIFSFLQNLQGSKRHSEHSARGSAIGAQNLPTRYAHHDRANDTETGTQNSTAGAGDEKMREAEEERQFEEDDKGVPGILSRVVGFAAICPLVGTDEVGVPLSDELSTEFASFLQGTSAQGTGSSPILFGCFCPSMSLSFIPVD